MTKRKTKKYPFDSRNIQHLLSWAMEKECFSFVNGNNHTTLHGPFPQMIFAGKVAQLAGSENPFGTLEAFINLHKDWIYGYFSYELKNEIEDLSSNNPATIPFKKLDFIVPETVVQFENGEIAISSFINPDDVYEEISLSKVKENPVKAQVSRPHSRTTKKHYFERIEEIKNAIVEGEYYEMNYCIEYNSKAEGFDPLQCYLNLNKLSPMPFSCFMKIEDKYLICASPERFLKKEKDSIISQPIKGTIKRSFDKAEDELLKQKLLYSEKERAENLMIVDLVRNDLAKSAQTGSVKVEELFGIYSFSRVHQMISTVSSIRNQDVAVADIIKHAFPMGSMTGAPKIRVMQKIEKLEDSARGLYSGAVGFFRPDQDFDFNVVIRSIIHHAENGSISFHVGSAITHDSDAEYEYNECLLKAEALFEVLGV